MGKNYFACLSISSFFIFFYFYKQCLDGKNYWIQLSLSTFFFSGIKESNALFLFIFLLTSFLFQRNKKMLLIISSIPLCLLVTWQYILVPFLWDNIVLQPSSPESGFIAQLDKLLHADTYVVIFRWLAQTYLIFPTILIVTVLFLRQFQHKRLKLFQLWGYSSIKLAYFSYLLIILLSCTPIFMIYLVRNGAPHNNAIITAAFMTLLVHCISFIDINSKTKYLFVTLNVLLIFQIILSIVLLNYNAFFRMSENVARHYLKLNQITKHRITSILDDSNGRYGVYFAHRKNMISCQLKNGYIRCYGSNNLPNYIISSKDRSHNSYKSLLPQYKNYSQYKKAILGNGYHICQESSYVTLFCR